MTVAGSGAWDNDFNGGTQDAVFGGESNLGGSNFTGAIDEIRISDIARASDGFMAIPEPGTYALLAGCFALASVIIRRRR